MFPTTRMLKNKAVDKKVLLKNIKLDTAYKFSMRLLSRLPTSCSLRREQRAGRESGEKNKSPASALHVMKLSGSGLITN